MFLCTVSFTIPPFGPMYSNAYTRAVFFETWMTKSVLKSSCRFTHPLQLRYTGLQSLHSYHVSFCIITVSSPALLCASPTHAYNHRTEPELQEVHSTSVTPRISSHRSYNQEQRQFLHDNSAMCNFISHHHISLH
jgi:hypothetical protein